MRLGLGLILSCLLFCLGVTAQSVVYPNFSSTAGLQLNGTAAQVGTALRLNPTGLSMKGSMFNIQPLSVVFGFDTTFRFDTSSPSGGGADGIAFVIHNDSRGAMALADHAGAMGYGRFVNSPAGTGLTNSLAIELDMFQANNIGDTSGNEISVHTNGVGENDHFEAFSIGRATPATQMDDGNIHTVRILYVPGTLTVFLDNVQVLTVPYDFNTGGTFVNSGMPVGGLSLINSEFAYVGFTAATGGSWQNHDLTRWRWDSPVPGPAFAGSVGLGAGGPFDVLTVNGDAGGTLRRVDVPVAATWTLEMNQPPTTAVPARFYCAGFIAFALPNAAIPLPFGIGDFVFPLPFPGPTATTFILAESFGLGSGLAGATPTPWTLSVGGVPFPIDLTFQAFIEETPGVLKTTNAVYVRVS